MPVLEALGHLLTILEDGEQVPSRSEVLGDRTIGGEEPLRMSWGLEALQAPLALAGGLMGVLRAVIEIAVLAMFRPRQDVPLRGPIPLQLVCDDDPRDILAALEQLAEELLSRVFIPPTLDQDIQDMTVLIHGPPQIVPLAIDREEHLVQVPCVTRSWAPATQLICILLPKFPAPLSDGFIRHTDPPCKQELFHVAVAQAEAVVEPDAMADDLGRETMVCVWVGWCGCVHSSLKIVYRHEEKAFLSQGAMVEG
jgi:hypothetical protein